MSELHKIGDDLAPIQGREYWFWQSVGYGFQRIVQFLASHAEYQEQFPEDHAEADD